MGDVRVNGKSSDFSRRTFLKGAGMELKRNLPQICEAANPHTA